MYLGFGWFTEYFSWDRLVRRVVVAQYSVTTSGKWWLECGTTAARLAFVW